MIRTAWLQDRRMQKFCDVLNGWERKDLLAQEAGEILGMSEWQIHPVFAKIAAFLSDQPVAETELSLPHLNHAASSACLKPPALDAADHG